MSDVVKEMNNHCKNETVYLSWGFALRKKVVHPTGLEPVTSRFGGVNSIQLSYGWFAVLSAANTIINRENCLALSSLFSVQQVIL